jgi:hypothetical protein
MPHRLTVLTLLLAAALAPAAQARPVPHIHAIACVRQCLDARTVAPGGLVKVTGSGFSRGMRAVFQVNRAGGKRSADMRVTSRSRATVVVPARALAGVLYVRDRAGRRSNGVRRPLTVQARPAAAPQGPAPTGTAFDGNGMWVWYVSKSQGGDPQAMVAQAQAHGVTTVFVKSSDGTSFWPQFSPDLLAALKAGGLRVCAWQFVYGKSPETEAQLGAQAVQLGADCLVVDAESQYEGLYGPAQRYVSTLRGAIGPDYPVGLTSFPYVDYHPALPYSVFLGPGAAQFDVPQVYWKEIGGGLDAVMDHTYRFNRPYGRPIVPLGQVYDDPPAAEIERFRQLAAAQGSAGVSWWDWQEARPYAWDAVGAAAPPAPATDWATLAKGAKGDLVVWAQEHLAGAGQPVTVDGSYDTATETAVGNFQAANALPVTGAIDTATWQRLLTVAPVAPDWTSTPAPKARASALRREIRIHGQG